MREGSRITPKFLEFDKEVENTGRDADLDKEIIGWGSWR